MSNQFKVVFLGEDLGTIATFVTAFGVVHGKVMGLPLHSVDEADLLSKSSIELVDKDGFAGEMDLLQMGEFAAQIGLLRGCDLVEGVNEPDEAMVKSAFERANLENEWIAAGLCVGCGGDHSNNPQSSSTGDSVLDAVIASLGGSVCVSGGPGFIVLKIGSPSRDDSRRS